MALGGGGIGVPELCQVGGPWTWAVRNSGSRSYVSLKLQVPGFLSCFCLYHAHWKEKSPHLGELCCLPSMASIILCHLFAPDCTPGDISTFLSSQERARAMWLRPKLSFGEHPFWGDFHAYYFPHLMQPNAQNQVGQAWENRTCQSQGRARDIRAPPLGELGSGSAWMSWLVGWGMAKWGLRLALCLGAPQQGSMGGTGLAYRSFALRAYLKSVTQILPPETTNLYLS